MIGKKRNFRPEEAFFIIDSDNLERVESQLFGFTLTGNVVIDDFEALEGREPDPEGAFVFIRRDGNRIVISQDFSGSYGIFCFEKDGYFAFSNSFLMLLEHVRRDHRLTLNREVADYMLCAELCSVAWGETMVNEITFLDRGAVLEIDIPSRTYEVHLTDYLENTVEPDTEEGLAILDRWHDKWARRIRNIAAVSRNIRADLSGGFDTRQTLSLLLSSGIDLNRILIYSKTDQLHTHTEDFRIASAIAEHYGFALNQGQNMNSKKAPYSLEDMMNIVFHSRLCFHRELYFSPGRFSERRYIFTGFGGGMIREMNQWGGSEEDYIRKSLQECEIYSGSPVEIIGSLKEAAAHVIQRSFDGLRAKYEKLGRPFPEAELIQSHYRETRCRSHFGTISTMQYPANIINLNPLIDPDLHRLKLRSEKCRDSNLLSAVILGRYAPALLDFEFEGGRAISPETIAYARSLSQKIPFSSGPESLETDPIPPEKPFHPEPVESVPVSRANEVIKNAFLSPRFRHLFESEYDVTIYEHIVKDCACRSYFPLSLVCVPVGIVKVLRDIAVYETLNASYAGFLIQQPGQKEPEMPVQAGAKASFPRRVVRRLDKAARVLLHG